MREEPGFIGVEKDYPDVAACVPHRGKDKKGSKEIKAAYLEIILKNPGKYGPILDYIQQRVESG